MMIKRYLLILIITALMVGPLVVLAVDISALPNITKTGSLYEVENANVTITDQRDDVVLDTMIIKNSGGLSFGAGADVVFGEPLLDSGGQLIRDGDGIPQVKSYMTIIEEDDSFRRPVDNFRLVNATQARFNGGITSNPKFYGVNWIIKGAGRTDFDVNEDGAAPEFYNSKIVIEEGTHYNHFSSANIVIDGLTIDHRGSGGALEFLNPFVTTPKNLTVVDNNPGSDSRHVVYLGYNISAGQTVELEGLQARNIALWQFPNTATLRLINPKGNVFRSSEATGRRGILEGVRDYRLNVIDAVSRTPVTTSNVYISRVSDGAVEYFETLDANGEFDQELLQYTQIHNQAYNSVNYFDQYQVVISDYMRDWIAFEHAVAYDTQIPAGYNETTDILSVVDTNLSEMDVSTVAAYTEIDSLDKLYDRAKLWKTDQANIPFPSYNDLLITNVDGVLDLGSLNLTLDSALGVPFSVNQSTNTISIKTNTMQCGAGKFKRLKTLGVIQILNAADPNDCVLSDNVGTNGVLTLTGINNANVLVYDDADISNSTVSYQTNITGTVTIPFAATASTDYQVVVRREGFSEVNFEFDPSNGGFYEFPISQFRSLTIEGTPIYQNTGELGNLTMDFENLRINIGATTYSAQSLYDTLQDFEVTESGMKAPRIANYDGDDKVLLLNTYKIRNRDGASTVPGVNAFVFAESGGVLDSSNGSVQFLTSNTATVDKQEQIVKMIQALQGSNWNNSAEIFDQTIPSLVNIAGPGFDASEHSLSKQVDYMLERGILDVNSIKDLLD